MFDLEKQIAAWRQEMFRSGVQQREVLDELESHLRNDFNALMSSGKTESAAFQIATTRMGGAAPLRAEFKKLERGSRWPLVIGLILWIATLVLQARGLLEGRYTGKPNSLLFTHIITLTAGYVAAFLGGGFGVACVCSRLFRASAPARRRSWSWAISWFGYLAAGMTVVGLLSGMLWSRENLGFYWGGNLREIGALCVIFWFVGLWLLQQFGLVGQRGTLLMGIGGNIVVAFAWFSAILAAENPATRAYTGGILWLLIIFVGVHLACLVVEITAGPNNRIAKS